MGIPCRVVGAMSRKIGSSGGSTVVVRRGPQPTKSEGIMLIIHITKGLRFTKDLPQLLELRLIHLIRGTTGWLRSEL